MRDMIKTYFDAAQKESASGDSLVTAQSLQ
jgi:hypothetical protein